MKKRSLIAALLYAVIMLTACDSKPTEISGDSNTSSSSETRTSSTESSAAVFESISGSSSESSPESMGSGSSTSTITSGEPTSSPESSGSDTSSEQDELSTDGGVALYCIDDHKLIYGSNADKKYPMASITKVLTCSVALSEMDPETVITVGTERYLVNPGSSLSYIAKGQKLKLKDLVAGMMIASGNDAAYTVAVAVARAHYPEETLTDEQAVERFAGLMNAFAAKLGMKDSHFVTPDGWDNDDHYTTASDLIRLAEYVLTVPEICENAVLLQKRVVFETGEVAVWMNSNRLLDPESKYYCEDAIGLKTGTTDNAGRCLLGAFKKNGKTYVTVVTGAETDKIRYDITQKLYEMIG